jgi:hypothetical protein
MRVAMFVQRSDWQVVVIVRVDQSIIVVMIARTNGLSERARGIRASRFAGAARADLLRCEH